MPIYGLFRRTIIALLLVFFTQTAAAQRADDATAAPVQIDSSRSEYVFAYFRLAKDGSRTYGDEVTKITSQITPDSLQPIVVVFIHGWKHDGDPADPYVVAFREYLLALSKLTTRGRKLIGVYVAWPAKSNLAEGDFGSFGEVRNIADAVSRGGQVTQLLSRLAVDAKKANASLVIIGHSFGARILLESTKAALVNNVAQQGSARPEEPCVGNRVCHVVSGFGDLIVLLNPAFEAQQYETLFRFSGGNWITAPTKNYENVEAWPEAQPPLMLAIGAENDEATKVWWPMATKTIWPIVDRTNEKMTTTLTNYAQYQTHRLRCIKMHAGQSTIATGASPELLLSGVMDRTRSFGPIGCVVLEPVGARSNSPFIVALAEPALIDDHGGIWGENFREFLAEYVDLLQQAKRLTR